MLPKRVRHGKTCTALRLSLAFLLSGTAGLAFLAGSLAAHAADDSTPTIEKTFDYGTLIEHTIAVEQGPYRAALHLSQRRQAENSPVIVRSHLAYQYRAKKGHAAMPEPLFTTLLADLIREVDRLA